MIQSALEMFPIAFKAAINLLHTRGQDSGVEGLELTSSYEGTRITKLLSLKKTAVYQQNYSASKDIKKKPNQIVGGVHL